MDEITSGNDSLSAYITLQRGLSNSRIAFVGFAHVRDWFTRPHLCPGSVRHIRSSSVAEYGLQFPVHGLRRPMPRFSRFPSTSSSGSSDSGNKCSDCTRTGLLGLVSRGNIFYPLSLPLSSLPPLLHLPAVPRLLSARTIGRDGCALYPRPFRSSFGPGAEQSLSPATTVPAGENRTLP